MPLRCHRQPSRAVHRLYWIESRSSVAMLIVLGCTCWKRGEKFPEVLIRGKRDLDWGKGKEKPRCRVSHKGDAPAARRGSRSYAPNGANRPDGPKPSGK